MEKVMLLDFWTLTDPLALLHALIVYRNSHERLAIDSMALNYKGFRCGEDLEGSLASTDAAYDCYMISGYETDNATLESENLVLASRLVTHAVKQGFITVERLVPPSPELMGDPFTSLGGVEPAVKLMQGKKHYTDGGRLQPANVSNPIIALGAAHWKGWDLTGFGPQVQQASTNLKAIRSGEIIDTLQQLSLKNFDDYFYLIDRPRVLLAMIEATKRVLEESDYRNEVRWFLPTVAIDAVTGGAYGHVQMLWKILRRKFQKPQ